MKAKNFVWIAVVLHSLCTTASWSQELTGADTEARSAALARRFQHASTELERKHLAGEALRLAREAGALVEGEEDMRLYLLSAATESMAADEPFPLAFDEQGMSLPSLSHEFVAWASALGLDPELAAWSAMYEHPRDLGRLVGETDPDVLALFEDALNAQNYFMAIVGASGLAAAGQTEAIEPIAALADASPADIALNLADALDEFGDPAADAEAARIRMEHQ